MTSHIRALGILNLAFGSLKIFSGLGLFLLFILIGGAIGVASQNWEVAEEVTEGEAGESLGHEEEMEEVREEEQENAPLTREEVGLLTFTVMGIVALVSGGALVLWGGLRVIVGIGLLRVRRWARAGAVALAVFDLWNFPLGTALGIYGLWTLLSDEARERFAQVH
ncbi:MAG: hypothetical protein ACYTHM_01240 [Planctomycetota bacterium]|jgi:hypothetical protein